MKKKKIYISGMITNLNIKERRRVFGRVATLLRQEGFDVVNPLENGLPQGASWYEHMRVDIRNLTECDCIYMLRGWEYSIGARIELNVAISCGIAVVMESDNKELLSQGNNALAKLSE